jgi:hypothetical protein
MFDSSFLAGMIMLTLVEGKVSGFTKDFKRNIPASISTMMAK